MRGWSRVVSGRRSAWAVLLGSVVVIGALFALLPTAGEAPAPSSGLPASSESARVDALLARFPGADRTAALLVWHRDGGLTADDRAAIDDRAAALATRSVEPRAVRPTVSDDGTTALVVVPLEAAEVDPDPTAAADAIRAVARRDLPAGLQVLLSGAVGFQSDIVGAFAGADLRLLLATVLIVAVLLIVTYRSPLLWVVPLLVVGTADGLARQVVSAVGSALDITLDASVLGIQSVLVFGAGTNYALLLIARYREELRRRSDRHEAMAVAVRSAGPTIAASGGTVALSLLTLLLGELEGNRALGFACAVGVAIALLFATVVLPAALVVFGRGLFWPFVPREGDVPKATVWERVGRGVARRPAVVVVVAALLLGGAAAGLVGARVGLSQTDQLIGRPESVRAQDLIDRSFPAGSSSTTVVLAPRSVADRARQVAEGVDGVASVRPGATAVGRTEIDVTLDAAPGGDAALATVQRLRSAFADAGGGLGRTLVGGAEATTLDVRDAAARDRAVVIPAILGVVFLVLVLLLRALVAPVLLLLSVVATYAAALGIGNVLFQRVLGYPAFDTSVPLFAFLFLVALGVDYNIFLTARAREERPAHGTRDGMVVALARTGGVITSAGVLLASVFVVLGVLPVVALAQIGALVGIGVLLDTLLVRTVLVPALAFLTGDAFWWPSMTRRRTVSAE